MSNSEFIRYRPIQKSDNGQVKKIILKSLEDYGANREGFAAKDPELENLSSFYDRVGGKYFVVECENKVIGGAGIAPLAGDSEIWELQKMYIESDSRGKGIGRRLMSKCIEEAESKQIQKLYIETLDTMVEANSLYQRFGFKKVNEPLGNTGHFGCDRYYVLELHG